MEQEQPKKRSKLDNIPVEKRGGGLFVKGKSGNPKGRKLGKKNFKTLFYEALVKLAASNGKDPAFLELEIFEKGILQARAGNYKFYQDMMDRLHNKPTQPVEGDIKEKITIGFDKTFNESPDSTS